MSGKYKVIVTKGAIVYLHPCKIPAYPGQSFLTTAPSPSDMLTRTGDIISVCGFLFDQIPSRVRSPKPNWIRVRDKLTLDDFEIMEEM